MKHRFTNTNPLRAIIGRRRYQTNSHPRGAYSVELTLECRHVVHVKASKEPQGKARCVECTRVPSHLPPLDHFLAYEEVRKGGQFNMLAQWSAAASAAGLSHGDYIAVQENYSECAEAYPQ